MATINTEKNDVRAATTGTDVHIAALKAAESLKNNEAFNDAAEDFVMAGETVRLGPITFYNILSKVYDADTLDAWPVPGSQKEKGSDKPYDLYVSYPNGAPVQSSFYGDLAKETVIGSGFADWLDALKLGKDGKQIDDKLLTAYCASADMTPDQARAVIKELVSKPVEYKAEVKKYEARLASVKKALTGFINLRIALQACETVQKVQFSIKRDAEGNLKAMTTPVAVWNKDDPTVNQVMSASSFSNLARIDKDTKMSKFDLIKAAGGTWEAFKEVTKRDQGDEGNGESGDDAANAVDISNAGQFASVGMAMYSFLYKDTGKTDDGNIAAILKEATAKDARELRGMLTDLATTFNWLSEKIERQYLEDIAAATEGEEEEEAA